MKPISLLMLGIGGYAHYYLNQLLNLPRGKNFKIAGAVDPYATASAYYASLKEAGVPIFDTVEEFYAEHTAEMAVVVTPIHLHAQQCIYCMEHGSDVLCEKPLCASEEDAKKIIKARSLTGRKLAVGFQWSFSRSILDLKRDIMSGKYGDIIRMRTIVFFPRNLEYYHRGSGWAGKRQLPGGEWLLDSIASNAAAHYLHNMLFLAGEQTYRSAQPADITAEVYRANPIEMFDTCALRVHTKNNAELLFFATHALPNSKVRNPEFILEGTKGTARLSYSDGDEVLIAQFIDGTQKRYDAPSEDLFRKLDCMGDAVRGDSPLTCIPETVLPHLECILALAKLFPETPKFPEEWIEFDPEAKQYSCKGLDEALDVCWRDGKLPYEEHMPWAQRSRTCSVLEIEECV